jgi:NTE family protein
MSLLNTQHLPRKTALVLSGGGARGAYQVGVLKGVVEILKNQGLEVPFKILSGTSAGAINTGFLAAQNAPFETALERLIYLWSNINTDQVFSTDFLSLNKFSLNSMSFQQLWNFAKKPAPSMNLNSLLDTAPLRKLINDNCHFENIRKNLENHRYEAVMLTANNYVQGTAVSFIQTPEIYDLRKLDWHDSRRQSLRTELNAEHIMASSAIPLLFPPIAIDGEHYGDGCVRNHTPCSPSIRLGAQKLFVVGVRTQKNMNSFAESKKAPSSISLIRIVNTLLNAVLLDSVEQDVQRIQRTNELVDQSTKRTQNLKKIPALCISPSVNLGELARQKSHKLPRLLRLTMSLLGNLDEASEILSYLLFDADYCKKLIDIGYHDALTEKKHIIDFFQEPTAQSGYTP